MQSYVKYEILICIIMMSVCNVIKLPAALGKLKLPLSSLPQWDVGKLRAVLVPLDRIMEQFDEESASGDDGEERSAKEESAEKLDWQGLSKELAKQFSSHYPKAPKSIRYVVEEIYRRAHEMLLLPKSKDRFELCLCHSLSFRTEMMLLFMQNCLKRFPAKSTELHCAIMASGDLLQEYILFSIMQDIFDYKKLVLYLIDLAYEDPQFEAGKLRVVETLPKQLQEQWKKKSFQAMMSEYHRELVKHAQLDEEGQHIEALEKVLNRKPFKVSVHHFRHVYGFIDWAQKEKIKLHALVMIDPYPINYVLEELGFGHVDSAYPTLSNVLFLKDQVMAGEDVVPSHYLILRHRVEHVPTVWYGRLPESSQGSAASILVNRMMQKAAKKMLAPVPWSLLFEEIEQYDPEQERVRVELMSEPYIGFDDVAVSLLRPDGLAYQTSIEYSMPRVDPDSGEVSPESEAAMPELYIFEFEKEKKRIKSGLPVQKMQDILKKYGFRRL